MINQDGQVILASGHAVGFITQLSRSDVIKRFEDSKPDSFVHLIGITDTGGTVDMFFRVGEIASFLIRDQPAIQRVK